MASFNQVILVGNLTRDPETRVTPKGTAICQFGIAVNRQFKDDSGQNRDETTFIDIEAWGRQAELIAKYLIKGSPAMIQGRLKLDQWEDKQSGQKRSKLKVVLENVQFLGSPRGAGPGTDSSAAESDEGDPNTPKTSRTELPQRRQSAPPPPAGGIDDDIPF